MEFGVNVVDHLAQEGLTVAVDLLNRQGGNRQTELSKDDFLGHVLNGWLVEVEQTHGGVLHDGRLGVNTDGKRGGDIDADVLLRKCVLKVDVDGHRFKIQKGIILDEGPDDLPTTVVTLRRSRALRIPVDDQNLVGWGQLVSAGGDVHRGKDDEHKECNSNQDKGFPNGGHVGT